VSKNPNQLTQEQQEKVKKNLLWVSIFSIIMLFAGITSAYIVSKGSDFWVDVKLPSQFFISTVFIIISSLAIYGATHFVKNKKEKLATPLLGFAVLIGLAFGYFQYQGFLTMQATGNAARGGIINVDGKYGENFSMFYNNKEISFDGYSYFYQGQEIDAEMTSKMKSFSSELFEKATQKSENISNYGIFMLKYKNQAIVQVNKRLELDGYSLSPKQKMILKRFAYSIATGSGDFVMTGKYGEDFSLKYADKPVEYKNRKFYQGGKELSAYLLNKLNKAQNKTGGFVFAFVAVHGLHWFAGMIVLLVLFINALKGKYAYSNYIGLKIGTIYWHFLGILWLYLYAFLIFYR